MAHAAKPSLDSVHSALPPPIASTRHTTRRRRDDSKDPEKSPALTTLSRADSETLPYSDSPHRSPPVSQVRRIRSQEQSHGEQKRARNEQPQSHSNSTPTFPAVAPEPLLKGNDIIASAPTKSPPPLSPRTKEQKRTRRSSKTQASPQLSLPLGQNAEAGRSTSQVDITALPRISDANDHDFAAYIRSKPTPSAQRASKYVTELYTISYLIFFAIFGTLARLGLQALTFYPGAPVIFSELWANITGTFIMGFLAEDRRLFRAEWGNKGAHLPEPARQPSEPQPDHQVVKARHTKVKKTIPLYIGLATGFCGSFTSFSSFIRDVFLSLSNNLRSPINHPYPSNMPTPLVTTVAPRNDGYSIMAILATIIITATTCFSALKVGAHFAILVDPLVPSLPFRFTRRVTDPVFVFLAWGTWLGAIVMAIVPPSDAWRGQALFACVFAPIGCLARYYISLPVNAIVPSFPLGTFTVNVFGTAVLGMAYDLQHVALFGPMAVGGNTIGCQVLQGIMDGFCGALTTVSTWILEMDALKRRHAYIYGSVSVLSGLSLLIVVMGSVRWTVGWQAIICVT